MKYDPDKHNRRTIRVASCDYREHGAYFVTICTHGRKRIFENEAFRRLAERVWSAIVGGSVDPDDVKTAHWRAISISPRSAARKRTTCRMPRPYEWHPR